MSYQEGFCYDCRQLVDWCPYCGELCEIMLYDDDDPMCLTCAFEIDWMNDLVHGCKKGGH